jgi:hypothetical protein
VSKSWEDDCNGYNNGSLMAVLSLGSCMNEGKCPRIHKASFRAFTDRFYGDRPKGEEKKVQQTALPRRGKAPILQSVREP